MSPQSRRRALCTSVLMLGLVSFTTSCSDATAPRSYSPSYALTSVNGQSVPAEVVSIPGVLSITDVSGTLSLNPDSSAVVLTHIHRVDASTGTLDYDQVDSVDYRIHGDSIEVGIFGPCPNICVPNLEGTVTPSTVTLTPKQTPRLPPIFRYDVEAEVLN
jgi:hypothetical protein